MPKSRPSRPRGRKTTPSAMREFVASNRPTGSTTSFPASDLLLRRQNMNIVQTPPRQLSNQITWVICSYDQYYGVSGTGPTETNTYFNASSFNGAAGFLACFDQYCIHSVVITLSSNSTNAMPISIWTALDYDSTTSIGLTGIQGLGTAAFHSIGGNGASSAERLLYPCLAPQVTSGILPVPGGVGRMWLDSAYPQINQYGFRSVAEVYASNLSSAIHVTYRAVFGFRNGF